MTLKGVNLIATNQVKEFMALFFLKDYRSSGY